MWMKIRSGANDLDYLVLMGVDEMIYASSLKPVERVGGRNQCLEDGYQHQGLKPSSPNGRMGELGLSSQQSRRAFTRFSTPTP